MGTFRYKAVDRDGNIVRGLKNAPDPAIILEELEKNGLTVKHIRSVGIFELLCYRIATYHTDAREKKTETQSIQKPDERIRATGEKLRQLRLFHSYLKRLMKSVPGKGKISAFTRELAILMRSGISLEKGLRVIVSSEEKESALQEVVEEVLLDIQKGSSLPTAFSKHSRVFPSEYIGLLRVGMETGKMAEIMDTLSSDLEREDRLYKRVRAALVYPISILTIAVACNLGIFLFLFPQIAQIIQAMHISLPLCTRILLFSSNLVKNPIFLITSGIVFLIIFFQARAYLQTPVGKYNLCKLKLEIPVLGSLNQKLFFEKFCRTMGMFYQYGVSVTTSLKMLPDIFENPYLEESLFTKVYQDVYSGEELYSALRMNGKVPIMVVNLVAVGGHTGDMAGCFYKISEFYEMDIDQSLQKMVTLIEPLIVSILGFFILFTMLSIFLPLYQAITAMGS